MVSKETRFQGLSCGTFVFFEFLFVAKMNWDTKNTGATPPKPQKRKKYQKIAKLSPNTK